MSDRWWDQIRVASRTAIGLAVFGALLVVMAAGAVWRASWIVNRLLRDWAARTIAEQSGGLYQFDLGEVRFDWALRRVAVDSISVTTRAAVNQGRAQALPALTLSLHSCTLSGVHFITLVRSDGLVASSLGCRSGTFRMDVPPRARASPGDIPRLPGLAFGERAAFLVAQRGLRLPSYAPRIRIARIVFPQVALDVRLPLTAGTTTRLELERLQWSMADLAIDPADTMAAARPLFSRSVELVATNFVAHPDPATTVRVGLLRTSLTDSTLEIRNASFSPLAAKPVASRYRTDRIHVAVGHVSAQGIDFGAFLVGQGVRARRVELDSFQVDVTRDNRLPANPRRPSHGTPQQWITDLDETLSFDSVSLRRGEIGYRQFAPGRNVPGVLVFTRIEGQATHVSHYVGRRTSEDPMTLTARTHVQDVGQLDVRVVMPLDAPGFDMAFSGTLGRMPVAVFNSFVAETRGWQIENGDVVEVVFGGSVRNGVTTGTVSPLFNDLSVSVNQAGSTGVLGNDGFLGSSARRLASFASRYRLRSDNPDRPAKAARIGRISREFTPDQTLVVYLWAGVRDGLLQVLER